MAKSKYPRQIVLNDPLREFVEHCEVYCSATCCELHAFELHPALLLRLCIDKNRAGEDGGAAFREAWKQLKELVCLVESTDMNTSGDQVPFWTQKNKKVPEFWLATEDVPKFFTSLSESFEKASFVGGLRGK